MLRLVFYCIRKIIIDNVGSETDRVTVMVVWTVDNII